MNETAAAPPNLTSPRNFPLDVVIGGFAAAVSFATVWYLPWLIGCNDGELSSCIFLKLIGMFISLVSIIWLTLRLVRHSSSLGVKRARVLLILVLILTNSPLLPSLHSRFLDGFQSYVSQKDYRKIQQRVRELNEENKQGKLHLSIPTLHQDEVPPDLATLLTQKPTRFSYYRPPNTPDPIYIIVSWGGKQVMIGEPESPASNDSREVSPGVTVGCR